MSTPLVTILMAVYNGEAYLGEAIESMLRQTFNSFEFIIIDDASTDNSRRLAESYRDPRIRIVGNPHNLRLAGSLNRGMSLARGQYIARMDADDVSLPYRLEKQVAFMESHKDIGLSGSWLQCFGDKDQIWDYSLTPGMINSHMLFQNQLGHSTIIMRRELMIKNHLFYNLKFCEAEDYELWIRCSEHFQLANLPEVLLLYRWHNNQASQTRLAEQRYFHSLVCLRLLKRLGITATQEEMDLHLKIAFGEFDHGLDFVDAARQWLLKIFRANFRNSYFPKLDLGTVLENHWVKICLRSGLSCPPLYD
ncbi:MAG: glycosyltransferase family 2 protein [Syntrophomonas sp.]